MKLVGSLRLFVIVGLLLSAITTTGCFASGAQSTRVTVEEVKSEVVVAPQKAPSPEAEKDRPSQEWPASNAQSSAVRNGIKISVVSGINGFAKRGDWLPVTVTIENEGEPVKGHVVVRPPLSGRLVNTYQQKVDLGHKAKKRLLFNTLLNPYENVPVEVVFVSNNKELVKTTSIPKGLEHNHQIVIALIDENANRQFFKDLTADQANTQIVYMDPRDLPFRDNTLSAVSTIVISGISTGSLTKEQNSVLSNWVASGGRLIVCGGPGWKKTASGIPDALLPVKPSGIKEMDRTVLLESVAGQDDWAGNLSISSVPVASASNIQGRIVIGDEGNPLVVSKDFGSGRIIWSALDITMEPFTSWRANPAFWNRLNQAQPEAQKFMQDTRFEKFGNMRNAISSIPALELPSPGMLIPYVLLYVIIIGPINYFILRRKNKKELAWITIPAVILFFSIGSFAYAYGKKGGDILVNQVNVIEYFPGANIARIHSILGIFSPSKRAYDVLLPLNSSVADVSGNPSNGAMVIEDGPRPKIEGMAVGMWSMRELQTERFSNTSPDLSGTITFTENGASILLNNKSKEKLAGAFVIAGRNIWNIGVIPALKEHKLDQDFKNNLAIKSTGEPLGHLIYKPWSASREDRNKLVMAETVNSVFGYQGEKIPKAPTLVAWLEKPLEAVEISGENPRITGRTALIVPLKIETGKGLIFPLGTIDRELINSTGSLGWNGPSFGPFTLSNGTATVEYSLPLTDKPYTIDRLSLHLNVLPGSPGTVDSDHDTALYDWESNTWHDLDMVSSPLRIDDAERFISPDGKIQVRISTSLQNVNVDVFDFEVIGKWQ